MSKRKLLWVLIIHFCLLSSCAPSTSVIPTDTITTATAILKPSITDSPQPSATASPTMTNTVVPWTQLERDDLGDYGFRCTITDYSFEIIELLPGIEAQGFLLCGDYQIPVGIYDKNKNQLFYWGLNPVQDPTILDHLGERALGRFVSVFGLGETHLDSKNVIGEELSMSINIPNSVNKRVFDTQNFGKYAGDFWVNQENVEVFAKIGILPNDHNILYPISLGIVK